MDGQPQRFEALESLRGHWGGDLSSIHLASQAPVPDAVERMKPQGPLFTPGLTRRLDEDDVAPVVFADAPTPTTQPCLSAAVSDMAMGAAWRREQIVIPMPEDGQLGLQLQELQVVHVTKSQAQLAGFQPGDVIAEINGVPVYNMDDLRYTMRRLSADFVGFRHPLTIAVHRRVGPLQRTPGDSADADADAACCLLGGGGSARHMPSASAGSRTMTAEELHRNTYYPHLQHHSGHPGGQRASDAALLAPEEVRRRPAMSKDADADDGQSSWFADFGC